MKRIIPLLLIFLGFSPAWASVTGKYMADRRPAEILHLSLIQIGKDIQGSILFVTARDQGKLDDSQVKVTGVTDGDTLMLTLSSGTVIQGHRKGNGILLYYPTKGQLVPILFKPVDTEYYSELVANWRDEHKLEYKRLMAFKESTATLDRTVKGIQETGLPADTERLNLAFAKLEKSVAQMREVGNSIIARAATPLSCDEVYGALDNEYYNTLGHALYSGSFDDAAREYAEASNSIKARLKNGQISIDRLPGEFQQWRNSFPLAYPAPARPSQQDIDALIAGYKPKMAAAKSAFDATLQRAKDLHAEGAAIYKRARTAHSRARQTCK